VYIGLDASDVRPALEPWANPVAACASDCELDEGLGTPERLLLELEGLLSKLCIRARFGCAFKSQFSPITMTDQHDFYDSEGYEER
jgi:hypothetical protein